MQEYQCLKCSNDTFEPGEFHATEGTLSKLFDVQNQKFTTITCKKCFYTEIYKADSSTIENILDFFTG